MVLNKSTSNQIKRIPIKESTWRDLHDLKGAGESYDELLSDMIRRECDYREWKMITDIDENCEFIEFDPEVIMKED